MQRVELLSKDATLRELSRRKQGREVPDQRNNRSRFSISIPRWPCWGFPPSSATSQGGLLCRNEWAAAGPGQKHLQVPLSVTEKMSTPVDLELVALTLTHHNSPWGCEIDKGPTTISQWTHEEGIGTDACSCGAVARCGRLLLVRPQLHDSDS